MWMPLKMHSVWLMSLTSKKEKKNTYKYYAITKIAVPFKDAFTESIFAKKKKKKRKPYLILHNRL